MRTPEQARDYLESRRVKDAAEQQLAAVAALPDTSLGEKLARLFKRNQEDDSSDVSLREIGYAMLQRDKHGKPFRPENVRYYYELTEEQAKAVKRAWRALTALDPAERAHIFAAFFPMLVREMELLWQAIPSFPYQMGYARKAF